MQKYFIRHNLKVGDTTFLSDSDSEIAISQKQIDIEDPVEIETLKERFLGQVVDIQKASIEVEILKYLGQRETEYVPSITIIQSLSNETKFNYFIEKSVEIGIERVIPIESQYSLRKVSKAVKDTGYWNKLVKDATEQSRSVFPTNIERPIKIKKLDRYDFTNAEKICLTTESVEIEDLKSFLSKADIEKPFIIAIGPEKGWSSSDLDIFKSLGFHFVSFKGNILRTETTGLVIGSIVKYLKGEI